MPCNIVFPGRSISGIFFDLLIGLDTHLLIFMVQMYQNLTFSFQCLTKVTLFRLDLRSNYFP